LFVRKLSSPCLPVAIFLYWLYALSTLWRNRPSQHIYYSKNLRCLSTKIIPILGSPAEHHHSIQTQKQARKNYHPCLRHPLCCLRQQTRGCRQPLIFQSHAGNFFIQSFPSKSGGGALTSYPRCHLRPHKHLRDILLTEKSIKRQFI
jgi:hypothetical protein